MFGHKTDSVSSVVGMVAADAVWADSRGLHIRGWLDVGDPVGMRLHRMVKQGVLQWSPGFRLGRSHLDGDVRVLDEVDELVEISITPTPANTRTATHGIKEHREAPSVAELDDMATELDLPTSAERQPDRLLRRQAREFIEKALSENGDDVEPHLRPNLLAVPIRSARALDTAAVDTGRVVLNDGNGHGSVDDREEKAFIADMPVQIARFEC